MCVETHLHLQKVRQLFCFGLSHAVPRVRHKHHRHLVVSVPVHQIPETLFGSRDGGPAAYQHSVDVKEKPEQAAVLFTRGMINGSSQ